MGNIYGYDPNKPLAIVAAALFLIGAIIHLVQMIRYKTWFFVAFTMGAFMMMAGYIFRFVSAYYPGNITLYALQNLFIILPPTLFAATLYVVYGRIAVLVNETRASIVRPEMITKLFVCSDVLSFFTQCGGAGMMSVHNMMTTGEKLAIFGLALQLASFGIFLFVIVMFRFRMRGVTSITSTTKYGRWTWQSLFSALFIAAVLVIIRCVYRIVEFSQGINGHSLKHEVFVYALDCLPMLIVMFLFNVIHAGQVLPKPDTDGVVTEEYIKLTEKEAAVVGTKGRVISMLR